MVGWGNLVNKKKYRAPELKVYYHSSASRVKGMTRLWNLEWEFYFLSLSMILTSHKRNRTIVPFGDWLTSLSVTFSRSIHALACVRVSFPFQGWIIFHVWKRPHFVYPFLCRWTRGMPLPPDPWDDAAVNAGVQISVETPPSVLSGLYPKVILWFGSEDLPCHFPRRLHHPAYPPAVPRTPVSPHPPNTCHVLSFTFFFLYNSHLNGCKAVLICMLDFVRLQLFWFL